MKVVVQRSLNSNVMVDGKIVGEIDCGLVVLVGFTTGDDATKIDYIVDKIVNLRIFDDENGVMNKSLLDVNGSVLSISQFTLYADTSKGRRPSYANALRSDEAINLYNIFNQKLIDAGIDVSTGIFGADMKVNILNDGPVTIVIEK